jgi:DNA-binding NarL/FixJ family response regulator
MSIRVLLVGHGLLLEGLYRLLAETDSLSVVATVDNWHEAQPWLAAQTVDVVLVVTEFPLLAMTPPSFPGSSGRETRVVCLTMSANDLTIYTPQVIRNARPEDLVRVLTEDVSPVEKQA